MPLLQPKQSIDNYIVQYLIKENRYCETYRVEDQEEKSFFLKLFIMEKVPRRLFDKDGYISSINLNEDLRHHAILSVVERGTTIINDSVECQYIVTEYYPGELLEDKLNRDGRMPVEEALWVFVNILQGLHYLHTHYPPLVHNDITPRNILLTKDGHVKIIDMGHLSYCKNKTGNPPLDRDDLDIRYHANEVFLYVFNEKTDIFSATAVFYHMLFGTAPWNPEKNDNLEWNIRFKELYALRVSQQGHVDLGNTLSKELRDIIDKGLALNAPDRFTSAGIVLNALEHLDPNHLIDEQPGDKDEEEEDKKPKGFEAIAGMNDLKNLLNDRVLFMMKNKDKVDKYRLTPPNGMLLYGPPGCGKTFFAEKFAEECGYNFIMVNMSTIGSTLVHGTEENISKLFAEAEENAPTILCFDEFDAFVPARTTYEGRNQAGEVNEFLTHLNNCGERGVFVIATSNRPDMIDPAVLRTGRIDKQIFVPLPDTEARKEMFYMYLKDRPCDNVDTDILANMTEGYIASDISYICNETAMIAALNDKKITQDLLETTIRSIRPSIRPNDVKMYDDIRDKMEGISRKNSLNKIGFTNYE